MNNKSFNQLLIGNDFNKPSIKKLKNVSHKEFVSNPKLMNIFGLWGDSDNDTYINWNDCFPFDKKRHAIIPQALQQRQIQRPKTVAEYRAARQPYATTIQPEQIQPQQTYATQEEQDKAAAEYAQKSAALSFAAKMAFSGKGESSSRMAKFPGWQKYYNAIMWGDTGGLTGEEAKVISQLHNDLQGGYTEKGKVPDFKLPTGQTFEVQFTSQGASYSPIQQKTTTVYEGKNVYENVPIDVAKQAMKDSSVLKNYQPRKELNVPSTTNIKEIGNLEKARIAAASFGAGIGNILRGQSFYTPSYQPGRETLYPGTPVTPKIINVPEGYQEVRTTSGTKYVFPGKPTYSLEQLQNEQKVEQLQDKYYSQEKLKEIVSDVSEKIDTVTSLGYKRPTEEYYQQQYQRATLMGIGTGKVEAPTKVLIETPESKFKKKSEQLSNEYYYQSEIINQDINTKYQSLIDSGQLSYEQAMQQSEQEYNERVNELDLSYKEKFSVAEGLMVGEAMRADYPKALISGLVFGAVTVVAPPVGFGIMAIQGTNLLFNAGDTIKTIKEHPIESATTFGLGLAGFKLSGKIVDVAGLTPKVITYLKTNKLKLKDIKDSSTISFSDAVKIGVDDAGRTIWNVKQEGLTEFINKKTGKVIDKQISISNLQVVAETGEEAVKSAVRGVAISLRRSGWRFSQNKNQLNIKGQTSYVKGTATSRQVGEDLYGGTGQYDIFTGRLKGKIKEEGIELKSAIANEPQFSSTSNFISKRLMTVTGEEGIKEFYRTGTVTDVSPNFYFTKKGIRKSSAKRFKKEQIPSRDVSLDLGTSFEPKVFKFNKLDFGGPEPSLKGNLNLIYPEANIKAVAQAVYKSQMKALAEETIKNIVDKSGKVQKVVTPIKQKNIPGFINSALIESNYPMIVGGTKQGEDFSLSMTGNVVSDYQVETYSLIPSIKPRLDLKSNIDTGIQQKYFYDSSVGNINIQQSQLKILTKAQTETKVNVDSVLKIFSGISQVQQTKQQQTQKQQQFQLSRLRTSPRQRTPEPTKPKTPTKPIFIILPGEEEKQRREQAFEGYAKVGKSWKKVTPLSTKRGAVDLASKFVDENISAQFRVVKAKKKVKGKEQYVQVEKGRLYQGNSYWSNNQTKFRRFKQRQGVRTNIPNGGIELQRFRLDSPGEVKTIKKAKAQAENMRSMFGF